MLNVKNNFGSSSPCPLFNLHEDNQNHLLDCIWCSDDKPSHFQLVNWAKWFL